MFKFKPGDRVKCTNATHYGFLTLGEEYILTAVSEDLLMVSIDASVPSHSASRFTLVERPGHPETMTVSTAFAASQQDQIEARLMFVWKAVPTACCSKCGAPHSFQRPCAYHPEG